MVSNLCCLGPLFKQQGKYYPRKNETRRIEQLERMGQTQTTWQDSQHDEAEYPYEWLKSTSTRKQQSGRGRRRRFLSRIRAVHAICDDPDVAEDFIFNSIIADEECICEEKSVATGSELDHQVTESRNDVTAGQNKNISSGLEDNAISRGQSPPSSLLTEDVKRQGKKESIYGKDTPPSSEKYEANDPVLDSERRRTDTSPSSPPSSASTDVDAAKIPTPKDTNRVQKASEVNHTYEQEERHSDEREDEQSSTEEVLITPENVREYLGLDEDVHEQLTQDSTRGNHSTSPRDLPVQPSGGPSAWYESRRQQQNHGQRENAQSQPSGNEQVVDHQPQSPIPHELPQQPRQQSHPEHRVRQLSDMEQIQRTLYQYHMQRRSRPDEAERGDRRQERHGQRNQHPYLLQRSDLAGQFGTARNSSERIRENVVRELRQQAIRHDQREGYSSRVMAMVRHSQHVQNVNDPLVSYAPPDLERRVRPAEIERIQRLNPHPPRRRRRCQKHYKGAVFQPKKE